MAADRELVRTLASQPGFASVTATPDLTASVPAFSDSSAASAMRKCAGLAVAYQHGGGAAQSGWSGGVTLAVASSKLGASSGDPEDVASQAQGPVFAVPALAFAKEAEARSKEARTREGKTRAGETWVNDVETRASEPETGAEARANKIKARVNEAKARAMIMRWKPGPTRTKPGWSRLRPGRT
ncbi:hypothetical protein HPB47_015311 [Ixodes persulcatus]|uniref:Uncharacterized protein n=1 Tax=Ixodes persulcatus TaxID=34615 RepID=A0AC60QTT6_IXOPE|nr:hypothetical protein HPB47_015311 [Ixodes persulcatus]